jgi:hypothetical protein
MFSGIAFFSGLNAETVKTQLTERLQVRIPSRKSRRYAVSASTSADDKIRGATDFGPAVAKPQHNFEGADRDVHGLSVASHPVIYTADVCVQSISKPRPSNLARSVVPLQAGCLPGIPRIR